MSSKILSVKEGKKSLRERKRAESDFEVDDYLKTPFRGLPNRILIGIVVSLCVFGLMAVFSASAPEALNNYHDATMYLRKQTIACMIGLFVMYMVSKYDYRKLKKFAWPLTLAAIFLLALTLVPGLATTSFGSSRWLQIGSFQFQPSEMAKISTLLILASGLSKHFWYQRPMLFRITAIMVMAAIVLKQPDLGSTMMIMSGLLVLLYVTGTSSLLIFSSIFLGAIAVWQKILHTPYQMARIESWLNPYAHPQAEGWNIIQAQFAIGSGGWFGTGFGGSLQKLHYLPVQHADFIFAVIAEELGLVGCLCLLGMFAAFGYYGYKTARDAQTMFGRLLAIGITSSICIQALVNVMVATGLLPITGITLPFVSYGGSSLVVTLFMVGILLSVSRDRKEEDYEIEEELKPNLPRFAR
ncbi:MAG: putative lipid II flippase FtsW [Cyanobacteriota/Melainabacteria group bacterium]